jgi:hypothetical protein
MLYVYSPYKISHLKKRVEDPKHAALRLRLGLQFILETDSRALLLATKLNYLHLIGEDSKLVNYHNVVVPIFAKLIIVPKAGMRVIQNNFLYCRDHINQFLKERIQ